MPVDLSIFIFFFICFLLLQMSFSGGNSHHANSKKSLVFLLKFLSDLVPFEPPQYLKVTVCIFSYFKHYWHEHQHLYSVHIQYVYLNILNATPGNQAFWNVLVFYFSTTPENIFHCWCTFRARLKTCLLSSMGITSTVWALRENTGNTE